MKKVIVLIFALIMVLGLVGCSSAPAEETTSTPQPTEEATQTPEATPVATESQMEEETLETIKELKLGETASTDIFELTLDNADLAIALENSWDENFFLPKEYNAEEDSENPFVAATGHTLVAMTYTAKNLDGTSIEVDGTFNPTFITVEYNGEQYPLDTEYGCAKENGGEWEDIVGLGNVLLQANQQTTRRCYGDVSVETDSLDSMFKVIFHLPTSSGETEDFVYVVN